MATSSTMTWAGVCIELTADECRRQRALAGQLPPGQQTNGVHQYTEATRLVLSANPQTSRNAFFVLKSPLMVKHLQRLTLIAGQDGVNAPMPERYIELCTPPQGGAPSPDQCGQSVPQNGVGTPGVGTAGIGGVPGSVPGPGVPPASGTTGGVGASAAGGNIQQALVESCSCHNGSNPGSDSSLAAYAANPSLLSGYPDKASLKESLDRMFSTKVPSTANPANRDLIYGYAGVQ
jgi:hypothetical protein